MFPCLFANGRRHRVGAALAPVACLILAAPTVALAQNPPPPLEGTQRSTLIEHTVEQKVTPGSKVTRKTSARFIEGERESAWQLNAYFDLGGALTYPDTGSLEGGGMGYGIGLGLRANYDSPKIFFGLGLGWQRTSLEGRAKATPSSGEDPSGADKPFVAATLLVQGLETSLQVQWHLDESLVLGPVLLGRFGSDVTYSFKAEPRPFALLVGPQVGWNRPASKAGLNYRLALVTDVSISRNQIVAAVFTAEVGVPFIPPDRVIKAESIARTKVRQEEIVKREIKTKVIVQDVVRIDIPRELVLFTGERKGWLTLEAQRAIGRFARDLVGVGNAWESVRVEVGVASKGTSRDDLRLSIARADAIRNSLVSAGVPVQRVRASPLGSEIKGNDPNAAPTHREYDEISFVFAGVKNDSALKTAVETFKESLAGGRVP